MHCKNRQQGLIEQELTLMHQCGVRAANASAAAAAAAGCI